METMVYIFPPLVSKLTKKVNRLNKRAAKLGLDPVSLTVNPDSRIIVCKPNGKTVHKIQVRIAGTPIFLKGWEYLGSVSKLSTGAVLVSYDAPEEMRRTPTKCDHCGTNRRRAVTVALRNAETGEVVQVGKTCLADYLDDSDAVALAEWLAKLDKVSRETEQDSFDGSGKRLPEPETFTFMAMVAAVVREDGCYRNQGGTAWTAERDYFGLKLQKGETRTVVTDADRDKAREVVGWIRNLKILNSYLTNVKASLAGEIIPTKAIRLAASAIVAYKIHLETEAERKAREIAKAAREAARKEAAERNAGSRHFGTVKVREDFDLIVTACRHFEAESYGGYNRYNGGYETKTAVAMTDTEGNLAVWFTSGAMNYRLGEVFKVRATVKKHGQDRDGNAQTVLTRCAFPEGAED